MICELTTKSTKSWYPSHWAWWGIIFISTERSHSPRESASANSRFPVPPAHLTGHAGEVYAAGKRNLQKTFSIIHTLFCLPFLFNLEVVLCIYLVNGGTLRKPMRGASPVATYFWGLPKFAEWKFPEVSIWPNIRMKVLLSLQGWMEPRDRGGTDPRGYA